MSRTLIALQKDIIRTRNRIRKFLQFHGIEVPFLRYTKVARKRQQEASDKTFQRPESDV